VEVNCAAIPEDLIESELFGHEKGSFTGATARRQGKFDLAHGGTLFLDEIGDMGLALQARLLRVLEDGEVRRLGETRGRRTDVRVIAATHRRLEAEVAAGRFRADLYFRLNVLPIRVPSLRERPEDVPLLAQFFVERFAREMGKHIDGIAADTMERLVAYDWPGNIRELQNVIERAVVLATGRVLALDPSLLGARSAPAAAPVLPVASAAHAGNGASASLADVEAQHLRSTLERCNWVIEGARGAAQALGLHPNTLRSRMKKLGIARPPAPSAG
jgi:transcriptional regulator with GAF, ATPase, and Fis domain